MKLKCFVIFIIPAILVWISVATAQQQTIAYEPPASASEPQTIANRPTPTTSPISQLASLNFKLGIAYHQAQLCQNFTIFNSLVDPYNAWVKQYFGEGADALYMTKKNATDLTGAVQEPQLPIIVDKQLVLPKVSPYGYLTKSPFNASSDLSKFGKQDVRSDLLPGEAEYMETTTADRILQDFLRSP